MGILRCAAVLTLAICVSAGCGFLERQDSGPKRSDATNSAAREQDSRSILERAEYELTARCMREAGFRYPTLEQRASAEPTPQDDPMRTFPFGIDDTAWAAKHGYPDPPKPPDQEQQSTRDPVRAYVAKLPPKRQQEFTRALYGDIDKGRRIQVQLPVGTFTSSVEGCTAEAQEKLYGDHEKWTRAVTVTSNLDLIVYHLVTEDPSYRRALSKWSDCVSEAGYVAENPGELYQTYTKRANKLGDAETRELSRTMATVEARCVRDSNLSKVGHRTEDVVRKEARLRYRDELRTVETARAEGVRLATRILENS